MIAQMQWEYLPWLCVYLAIAVLFAIPIVRRRWNRFKERRVWGGKCSVCSAECPCHIKHSEKGWLIPYRKREKWYSRETLKGNEDFCLRLVAQTKAVESLVVVNRWGPIEAKECGL